MSKKLSPAFEVDEDIDFSSPVLVKSKLYSPSYMLADEEALANGNYYWRVMQRGKVWIVGVHRGLISPDMTQR